ncbi:MAG: CotH kinase family protein [Treponema sp.]|nr:CotH kinase family protein [Treponema sp.]MCL2251815.1 CotH kinase family protein [Treponema sp.]
MKKICLVLAICCLFASCEDPNIGGSGVDENSSSGRIRAPNFSHTSGLYSQSFKLTISTTEGNSIYYSIDGSIPDPKKVDNKTVFKYTSPITIADRNNPMQANLLATPANSTNLYGRTDDPRGSMPSIHVPTNAQVPKATVICAAAYDSSGSKRSDIATRTFFIGNNLANYADAPIISLVSDPYNLVDEKYGIMVRGVSTNRWNEGDSPTHTIYNFLQRGTDWERVAFMEFFAGNASSRSVPISQNVGIRVRGGWSRAAGQKSFNVYFRSEYGGINTLTNYPLIPGAVRANGTPVGTYKSFMLRNGGNDAEATKMYDVFIQNLLTDRAFTVQAGVPCIVYINGEYWGFYNIQERYSDNATEYKYGVNRNNVISFDNGALDDGNPGEDSLYWDLMEYRNEDLSDSSIYNQFCNLMDIQSFIDYFAANIYINNQDWPHNNYRLWRTRTVESGNPYGDTKWRWQMFDTEYAAGIYDGGNVMDGFYRILNGDNKDHQHSQLLKKLLTNQDFKRQFVNTMMDLYNINFHPDSFIPELERLANIYRPLMADYNPRFGGWYSFDSNINNMRNYLTNVRDTMVNQYLPQYCGVNASNLKNVTISARDDAYNLPNAEIKLNSSTLRLAGISRAMKYYSDTPITVTANTVAGYQFTHWTVTGGSAATPSSASTTITLTGNDVQITANYNRSSSITISGNLTLTGIAASAGYAKLILHNANSTWRREIGLNITSGTASWTTTIAPFTTSTPITFRVEAYQNSGSSTPLYTMSNVKTINVYNANVSGVSVEAGLQSINYNFGGYANSPAAMTWTETGNSGEYSANVTAVHPTEQWQAALTFDYASEATAGTRYTYTFSARTASGTRDNLYVQYYWTEQHSGKGSSINLTSTYQQFTIDGEALPTANGSSLAFQCALQTGQFFVKDLVIMPAQ